MTHIRIWLLATLCVGAIGGACGGQAAGSPGGASGGLGGSVDADSGIADVGGASNDVVDAGDLDAYDTSDADLDACGGIAICCTTACGFAACGDASQAIALSKMTQVTLAAPRTSTCMMP